MLEDCLALAYCISYQCNWNGGYLDFSIFPQANEKLEPNYLFQTDGLRCRMICTIQTSENFIWKRIAFLQSQEILRTRAGYLQNKEGAVVDHSRAFPKFQGLANSNSKEEKKLGKKRINIKYFVKSRHYSVKKKKSLSNINISWNQFISVSEWHTLISRNFCKLTFCTAIFFELNV